MVDPPTLLGQHVRDPGEGDTVAGRVDSLQGVEVPRGEEVAVAHLSSTLCGVGTTGGVEVLPGGPIKGHIPNGAEDLIEGLTTDTRSPQLGAALLLG